MWCSYDGSQARDIESRMSAADRAEAQRLYSRILQIHEKELKFKEQLKTVLAKYQSGPRDEAVRSWGDIVVISAAVVARSPVLRKFAVDQAKDYAVGKAQEIGVKSVAGDNKVSETVLTLIDWFSSSNPYIAGLKAFAPASTGTGDDRPNEVQAAMDNLSAVEKEYATCFMLLGLIVSKYDPAYLSQTLCAQGPQLRAAE